MAKEPMKSELSELAQPLIIHIRDGVKAPNIVTTIELRDGASPPTARSGGSYLLADKLDWHPAGIRVTRADGAVFVVPMDRIDTVFQVRPPRSPGRTQ